MSNILNPKNPRWDEFADRLKAATLNGCHGSNNTEAILHSMGDIDVAGSLAFFQQHGGFCDCEIVSNVALREENGGEEEEDDLHAPTTIVRF